MFHLNDVQELRAVIASENTNEFQSNSKSNMNSSLKKTPVRIPAFNVETVTNTAVRRLMTWDM